MSRSSTADTLRLIGTLRESIEAMEASLRDIVHPEEPDMIRARGLLRDAEDQLARLQAGPSEPCLTQRQAAVIAIVMVFGATVTLALRWAGVL